MFSIIIINIYYKKLLFIGANCEGAGYYDNKKCLMCSDGYEKTPNGAGTPGVCGCNSI